MQINMYARIPIKVYAIFINSSSYRYFKASRSYFGYNVTEENKICIHIYLILSYKEKNVFTPQ